MKKKLTFVLAIIISVMFTISAFASTYSNGWNGGEKLNFTPLNYHNVYSPSDWSKDLVNKYGLTWYENPTRFALKGEVMLLQLRTIQASLKRQGCKPLSANGETLVNFKDNDSLVPSAEEEAKILKAIGILSGDSNVYMNMGDYITRAEVAKILTVTNQSVLSIPVKRSDNTFTDISNSWAKDYISYVYKIGIMDGVNSLKFYPDNVISIEQILTVLNNEVGYYGITEQDIATAMNETFKVTFNLDTTRVLSKYSSYNVKKNDSTTIKVNVYPYTNKDLQFSCNDESICKITSINQYTDTITVKGIEVGTTYVRVNIIGEPNVYTIIPVYVTTNEIPATGITLNKNLTLEVGDRYYLTATVLPYNATNKTVKYYSSDSNIAVVNSNGRVTGVSKGVTVITAQTHNGYQASSIVTVTDKTISATGITVTNDVTIEAGYGYYLTTSVFPYNATDKTVKYYSNDTSIVQVNSDGKITGISKGVTVITAQTHNGYTDGCVVIVTERNIPATGITTTNNVSIKAGYEYYLTTSVFPYNATNKTVKYYSNDNSVAQVNSYGKVTGISNGTAVITAQTHNGYTASCVVTVTAGTVPATGITVTSNLTLNVAERYYFIASVLPYNATDKTVKYYSDDTNIASVNSTGRVTGVNSGVTVVTVESHNGYKAYCIVTVNDVNSTITNSTDDGRNFMYVNGYGESSYYNAYNNESMTFIVDTNFSINEVTLSNDNCYISKGVSSNTNGWQFTVNSRTLSQNGETLLTVKLSNGKQLTVKICIYP